MPVLLGTGLLCISITFGVYERSVDASTWIFLVGLRSSPLRWAYFLYLAGSSVSIETDNKLIIMETSLRNTLRLTITSCRRLLEEDYCLQLEGHYGIRADGQMEPSGLQHLDARGKAERGAIEALYATK